MWILDNPNNPFLLVFLGCVICLAAFVAWIQTGRREALFALIGLAILFIGLVVAERMMISDREAIEAKLAHIARHLQNNNREAVYDAIHPSATEHLAQARSELPQYTFEECRVTKIDELTVNSAAEPRTADVEFYVKAKGSFAQGGQTYTGTPVRIVRLKMEKDTDGEWKVKDYSHRAPLETP